MFPRALAPATALALFLCAPASADWPLYGHDLANSRDALDAGPARSQLPALAARWKFTSPTGDFTGTPAIAGGLVVAGDNGGTVYALDQVTGSVRWSRSLGAPVNASVAIDTAAPGGPTVLVPVAAVGAPRLVALAASSGALRWQVTLTRQPGADVFGSPVFWRHTVFIGTGGDNEDNSTARGSVVALDELTGHLRWQTFTVGPGNDGAGVWSTPAIDPTTSRLYVGTGNNYHPPSTSSEDSILALDSVSGQIVAGFQATAGDTFSADSNQAGGPDYDFGASPNLFTAPGGAVMVGEGQKSGVYWALDRATLRPRWHTAVGPGGPLGGILGSTAVDGGRLFGADTLSGQVFALGLGDGAALWQAPESAATHLSPTTVAGDVLYTVDPTGLLIASDPATGATLARVALGGPSFGGVAASQHALFVAVGTGPPPAPAPQQDGSGSIVAFGDTTPQAPASAGPADRVATAPPCVGARSPARHDTARRRRRGHRAARRGGAVRRHRPRPAVCR
jgi:polyvinyl alcohol dehydrogenase (cytochrome)